MKKNIGTFVIITLLILIVIIMLLKTNNQEERKISIDLLVADNYELQDDGGYIRTLLNEKRNNIQFERDYRIDKYLNEIEYNEFIEKDHTYTYRYQFNTNIGYGMLTESLEKGLKTARFYDAIYDFNTGKFSCNASASLCNNYLISIRNLKEKFLSYTK